MLYIKSINTSDGALTIEVTFDVGTNLDNANMLTRTDRLRPHLYASQC
ncbi:MAG: hypothetical protein U0W24_14060 [Bacteroidales bacterium]